MKRRINAKKQEIKIEIESPRKACRRVRKVFLKNRSVSPGCSHILSEPRHRRGTLESGREVDDQGRKHKRSLGGLSNM